MGQNRSEGAYSGFSHIFLGKNTMGQTAKSVDMLIMNAPQWNEERCNDDEPGLFKHPVFLEESLNSTEIIWHFMPLLHYVA